MFWLGYFLRKILLDDNLSELMAINSNQYEQWKRNKFIECQNLNALKEVLAA